MLLTSPPPPSGGGQEGFPSCDLHAAVALAGPPQKRTQTRQILPVCLRPEVRQRVRQPVPLRESGVARHR